MDLHNYIILFVNTCVGICVGAGVLLLGELFGRKGKASPEATKTMGRPGPAILLFFFVFFGAVCLIPWVVIYRQCAQVGFSLFLPFLSFILVIGLALLYALKKGSLEK
ncbi:MAG: hypothetical protein A2Y14_00530 [Verrucomicrobia bacterium GWF2_51_19]|nr:MAG: hypothetical protein A2Y14_00530 [Verrucomicrobia bacterium GWF2_51_19]HCJ11533.1 hypothetical protein [Opitutae bacterium]